MKLSSLILHKLAQYENAREELYSAIENIRDGDQDFDEDTNYCIEDALSFLEEYDRDMFEFDLVDAKEPDDE